MEMSLSAGITADIKKKGYVSPMALVTTKEMFRKAYEGKYAIGAFNINNMEIIQAITEAEKL